MWSMSWRSDNKIIQSVAAKSFLHSLMFSVCIEPDLARWKPDLPARDIFSRHTSDTTRQRTESSDLNMVAVVEKEKASTLMEHLCVRLVKLKATVSIMGKVEEKRRGDGECNSLTSDVHAK